jgi:hypothetical protein
MKSALMAGRSPSCEMLQWGHGMPAPPRHLSSLRPHGLCGWFSHTQRASWQRRHLGMGGGGEGIGREPLRAALLRPVEKSDQAIDKLGRLKSPWPGRA